MENHDAYRYEDYPINDDHSTRYTKRNIEAWISYWGDFFETERAESSLSWAIVKADLLNAISELPPALQRIFDLVGRQQLPFRTAAEIMRVDESSAKRYWRALLSQVVFLVRERTIFPQRCDYYGIPTSNQAVSWEGRWGDPYKR